MKSLSLTQYATELSKNGVKTLAGSLETLWIGHESRSLIRFPTFALNAPTQGEIRSALKKGKAPVVSYIIEPDIHHPANTWLYICRDTAYTIEKLTKNARRDIRKAHRTLRLAELTWETLLEHGASAFCDTRTRVGLSDGDNNGFRAHFMQFARNPAHRVIGAWKNDTLIAFISLVVVEGWVEIQGSFSASADRDNCPANGLCDHVLDRFLVQERFCAVSYGLSSIQQHMNEPGLHYFKQKAGFVAQPVHRVFVLHPLLRPFANNLSLAILNICLRLRPGNRSLKKTAGMLAALTQPPTSLRSSVSASEETVNSDQSTQ